MIVLHRYRKLIFQDLIFKTAEFKDMLKNVGYFVAYSLGFVEFWAQIKQLWTLFITSVRKFYR